MLNRIKASLGIGKPSSRTDLANSFDLGQRNFTKALLLRASHYQDEAMKNLKVNAREGKTLNEFAASCAATVAHHVTTEAMKSIGREAVFLPHDPVPNYAHMAVAFSLFVLAGLHGQIKQEGLELDFKELAAEQRISSFSSILTRSESNRS